MTTTKIEWAERVWNPITGCTKCSPACDHCYAERMSKRLAGRCGYPADDPFRVTLHEDKLMAPLGWRKPARIFVGSMTDIFHEDVYNFYLDEIFAVMALCPQHTFMLLTKRPERARRYIEGMGVAVRVRMQAEIICRHLPDNHPGLARSNWAVNGMGQVHAKWPLPNVWLGTTIWDQPSADRAVPILLNTPAAKRFVSVEPMLGPVRLPHVDFHCDLCGGTGILARFPKGTCHHCNGRGFIPAISTDPQFGTPSTPMRTLDWVICGGETGPGARPMHPDWPRSLRDQCQGAGVPFFFKQHGAWVGLKDPGDGWWPTDAETCIRLTVDGRRVDDGYPMQRVGKQLAGRELDGQEWSEVPA